MYVADKRNKVEPLTEIEKAMAEKYHNCIYTFLYKYHYSIEEFYDIAAIGFLKGVQKYCRRTDLQEQYSVATICIYEMKTAVAHHLDAMNTLKRKPADGIVSLDAEYAKDDKNEGHNILANCIGANSFEDDVLDNEVVTEILNSLSERQRQIAAMKLQGYTYNEIHSHLSISISTIYNELKEIKGILKERCGY